MLLPEKIIVALTVILAIGFLPLVDWIGDIMHYRRSAGRWPWQREK